MLCGFLLATTHSSSSELQMLQLDSVELAFHTSASAAIRDSTGGQTVLCEL